MSPFHPGSQSFRILSLDGGGVRGAFAAACLAEFEKQLACPVTSYFDLIAGTSTGGIIALALGLGVPARMIEGFYLEKSLKIFSRRSPKQISFIKKAFVRIAKKEFGDFDEDWILQSKYESAALREALTAIFGSSTLGDVSCCRLVIPAVDLIGGQTVVFKTPHLPQLIRDRSCLAVDVALATSAAPAYFPHATIANGSAYVDGGLWANNPVMLAYAEAIKIQKTCNREGKDPVFDSDQIAILSIGTGSPRYFVKPNDNDSGLRWWGPKLYDVVSVSQSQGEHNKARYVLGDRYHRIDFQIPDKSWSLDSVHLLSEYVHLGHQKAVENFAMVKASYMSVEVPKIEFFPS